MLVVLVFLTVFAVIAFLLLAFTAERAKESKQTLARLEAIRASIEKADEPFSARRRDELSQVPWIDGLLRRVDIAPRVRLLLLQADLKWTAGRLLLTAMLAGLVVAWAVYYRTESLLISLTLGVAAGAAPFLYVLRKRSERFDRMKQRLPEALDFMVAAIRVGHSLTSAMGMAAKQSQEPVRSEFRQCFDEQNYGMELRTAMLNLAGRVPTRDIRMITTAVLVQKETGGNLTEILEKVATLIRDDFRLERQIRVHTAQGRLTGWVLAILPLVLGIGLYMVDPVHMSILWTRPIGIRLLYGAAGMTLTGTLLIRRIVRIEI